MGENLSEKLQIFEGSKVKWKCDLNGADLKGVVKNIVGTNARVEVSNLPTKDIRWVRLVQLKRQN